MLQPRLLTLPIARQTRRGDIELRRDAIADLTRTSTGSAKNVPRYRTVASCTPYPSRL